VPQFSSPRVLSRMATSMTADLCMQERVLAHLTDPSTHPLVRRIGTHAAQRAGRILSQGHSVLAYAVFTGRMAASRMRGELSIGFVGLFLAAELATRLNRAGYRRRVRPDAGDCRTSGEI